MVRTTIHSPSIEVLREEMEESGSSDGSGDEPDPRFRRTRSDMIFRQANGESVFFAFHKLTPGQERHLTELIREHGGQVIGHPDYADTIVCTREEYDDLKYIYDFNPEVWVEEISFIRRCIINGKYTHMTPLVKGMGGRPAGTQLTKFNEVDVENLCMFLAKVIPYETNGGRAGRGVYQKQWNIAIARPDADHEHWILRHSAESWRSYYKSHKAALDPMIAAFVKENPPRDSLKGQYHLNRRYRGGAWLDLNIESETEEVEVVNVDEATSDQISHPQAMAGRRRKISELSLANSSRASNGHIAKSRRVDSGLIRVSDVDAGRTRRTWSSLGYHSFLEPSNTLVDDPNLISFHDDVNMDFLSAGTRWRTGPDPDEAGPSGTQRTPSPMPEDFSTLVLPDRASAIIPSRELSVSSHKKQSRTMPASFPSKAISESRRLPGTINAFPSQIPNFPTSSQATLVGPVPTQLHDVRQSGTARQEIIAGQESSRDSNQKKSITVTPRGPPNARNRNRMTQVKNRPIMPLDAPSRNTRARARSASVEPLHPEPTTTENHSPLQSLQEGNEEPDPVANNARQDSHEAEYIEEYLRSSFDEQLQPGTAGSVVAEPTQMAVTPPTSQTNQDDLTITHRLSQSVRVTQQEPKLDDDDKLIAEFLSSRRSSRNVTKSRPSSATKAYGTPVVLHSRGKNRNDGPMERELLDKTTEEEDFPLSGTRAAAVVDYVEKNVWTPLPGTRAAAELRRLSGLST